MPALPTTVCRVAKSGRSFDVAGYRVRLEAGHGDDRVPAVVADIVAAIEAAHARGDLEVIGS